MCAGWFSPRGRHQNSGWFELPAQLSASCTSSVLPVRSRGTTLCTAVPLQYDDTAAPASQQPPYERIPHFLCPKRMLLEVAPQHPPNPRKKPRGRSIHSCHNSQPGSIGIRSVVVPRLKFPIHLFEDRHGKRPPRHRFHSQRLIKRQSYAFRLSICSPPLRQSHLASSALTRVLRASAQRRRHSDTAGRLMAMAGAMKTFWVLLLVVAMAAVAVQAHNGEDHGPAAGPESEAPNSGAVMLLQAWLSPLLLAGAAFAASVFRS